MADVATPAALVASGVPIVALAGWLGFDPLSLGAGLTGVVVIQTLLPATAQGLRSIIGLGIGSMLLANIAAPFIAPGITAMIPNWQWLQQVDPIHIKYASAAFVGGFAQPLLMMARKKLFGEIPSPMGKVE